MAEEFFDFQTDLYKPLDHDSEVTKIEDEEDELGPIVDTPFRARCYTWPRQYLQGQPSQSFCCFLKPVEVFFDDF